MSFAFSNTKPDLTSSDYTERKKGITQCSYLGSLNLTGIYSNYDGTVIMNDAKIINTRSYNELLNITKGSYIQPQKDCLLSCILPFNSSSGNIGENTYTTVSSEFTGTDISYNEVKHCAEKCDVSGIDIDISGEYSQCNTNIFYHMKKKKEIKIDVSLANYEYNGFNFPAPIRLRTMQEITQDTSCCNIDHKS